MALRRRAPSSEPKWLSLLGASAAQAGLSYLEQGVPALVPYVKADLGLSSSGAGIFAASVNTGRAASSTLAGRLVVRHGNRRSLLFGSIASGAAGLGAAVMPSGPTTLTLLVAAGVLQSTAIVAGITGIGGWFPQRSRGTALGLRQAAVSAGGLLAAATLPLLAFTYGWRLALGVAGVITITVGSAGAWLYRDAVAEGAAVRIVPGLRRPSSIRLVLGDAAVRRTIAVAMTLSASQYVVLAYVQLHFIEDLGVGLGAAAGVLTVTQAAAFAGRLGWGVLSDVAFGGRRTGVIAMMLLLGGLGAIGMAVVPRELALAAGVPLAAVLAVATVGSPGIYVALLADIAQRGAEAPTIGAALSLVLASAVVGPPLFGVLADVATYDVGWIALGVVLLAQVPTMSSIDRLIQQR